MSNARHVRPGAALKATVMTEGGRQPRLSLRPEFKRTVLLISAGYVACLLSGFGTFLDTMGPYTLRALPLFVYTALLLISLQGQIISKTNHARASSEKKPIPRTRTAFTWAISGIALLYAAWAYFLNGPDNPVRFPATYIILNLLALVSFLYEFFVPDSHDGVTGGHHMTESANADTGGQPAANADHGAVSRVLKWAAKAGGLATFCLLVSLVLRVLATGLRLPFGIEMPPYVIVSIRWLPIPRLMYLQDLDLAIGLFAGFVTLALLCLATALDVNAQPTATYWQRVARLLQTALKQSWLSFRFAVSPLIWMIPAFSMATFSRQAAAYFRASAAARSGGVADLFNPLSATSLHYLPMGLADLGYAGIAIVAVLVAVAAYEHDRAIIRQALQLVGAAGRIFVFLFPAFFLSLTVLNAALTLVFGAPVPFQLITATVVTGIIALVYSLIFRGATSILGDAPGGGGGVS